MEDAVPVLSFQELLEAIHSAPPPTVDDVSITWDGRRLDTKEKVLLTTDLDPGRLIDMLSAGRPVDRTPAQKAGPVPSGSRTWSKPDVA